jgi:hypothetical protein
VHRAVREHLMATPLRAQSTGAIQGNIVDAQGAVVPGVTVTVRNVATGVERTTVSDAGGDYLTPSLAPGLYRIETRLTGFGDQSRDVEVDVARTSVVNIRLTVGPVAESVSVGRVAGHRDRDDVGQRSDFAATVQRSR